MCVCVCLYEFISTTSAWDPTKAKRGHWNSELEFQMGVIAGSQTRLLWFDEMVFTTEPSLQP